MTNAILRGKPDAGNPHVRFDEGEVASAKPRRGSLLYTKLMMSAVSLASLPVFAGVHTWCYTGSDPAQARWNVPGNWEEGVPEAGETDCEIVIPSSAAATVSNDIEGLELKSLTVSGSSAFTLTGQKVKLVPNTGKFTSTCDGFTLAMPIELGEGGTNEFAVGAAKAGSAASPVAALSNTFNAGVLTGKGGFKKTGVNGTIVLAGDNDYEGGTWVAYGFLSMSTPYALGETNEWVRIGSNHYETDAGAKNAGLPSKNDTLIYITSALDISYRFRIDRQCNNNNYSDRIAIWTQDSNTKHNVNFYGDINADANNNACWAVKTAGAVWHTYGHVALGYKIGMGATVHFHGPVTTSQATSYIWAQDSGNAYLYSTSNTFTSLYTGYGVCFCMAPNVTPANMKINTNYMYGSADALRLGGFDQTIGCMINGNWNQNHGIVNETTTPCRLTLTIPSDSKGRYHFNGPLTLVVDSPAGCYQQITNAAESTMSGGLIVSNGTFWIAKNSRFPNVNAFELGTNGVVKVTDDATVGNGSADLAIAEGGKFVLAEPTANISVKRLVWNGAVDETAYGRTFQSQTGTREGVAKVDWIEGDGTVTVAEQVIDTVPATWSSDGTSDDMTAAANWKGFSTAPSLDEGGLLPTFAEAGETASFAGRLSTMGIVFDAPNDFLLRGSNNPLVQIRDGGIVARGGHDYTIDAPVQLKLLQAWDVAADTTLFATQGLSATSSYVLTLSGAGTKVLGGAIDMTGNINLGGGSLILRDADVSSPDGIITETAASQIFLDNVVCNKAINLLGSTGKTALETAEGTTNVVNGRISLVSGDMSFHVARDSQLTVLGGMGDGGYNSVAGEGADVSSFVVSNAKINFSCFSTSRLSLHFWSSGNNINDYFLIQSDGRLYLHVTNALSASSPFWALGRIDLCGCPQQCGSIKNSAETGVFVSDSPAVLTVNQGAGANNPQAHAFVCTFQGQAGLRKLGEKDLTVNSANPTEGSLEAAGGNLFISATGSWNGTDVRVTGRDAVLGLRGSANLRREASLAITDPEARVDLADGVEQRIAHLYLPVLSDPDPETGAVTTNLVEATAGTWGSPGSAAENKSAFFTGTGLVKTGKFGLLILVR